VSAAYADAPPIARAPSRENDLLWPEEIITEPAIPVQSYLDSFGNLFSRLTAPLGPMRLTTNTTIASSPVQDLVVSDAIQPDVRCLPSEYLVYLLDSRYCETDKLSETAWSLFTRRRLGRVEFRRSATSSTSTSVSTI
jgi:hypothetical protein